MSELPADLRDQIIRRLYADAEKLDWEHLSGPLKTAQYRQWLDDEEVGGQLLRYKATAADVHKWIKDGPMKEYARAQLGVGTTASYVANPAILPQAVVRKTLGSGWSLMEGSVDIKPVRCRAVHLEGAETWVLWGKRADFKHLLWAALETVIQDPVATATLAIVEAAAAPTPPHERAQSRAMADRCSIGLRYIAPGS